jgi:D-alanyl-D-alanine carboxypeptidase
MQPSARYTSDVEKILTGLQAGKIDRVLFTANANSYFSEAALRDCRDSLGPLGRLKAVIPVAENLRGGMIHRSYRAEFAAKTVLLNIYVLEDGRYEQFLIEDQI